MSFFEIKPGHYVNKALVTDVLKKQIEGEWHVHYFGPFVIEGEWAHTCSKHASEAEADAQILAFIGDRNEYERQIEQLKAEVSRLVTSLQKQEQRIVESMANAAVNCGPNSGCWLAAERLRSLESVASGRT